MGKEKKQRASKITDEQIVDLYLDRNEKAISETDAKYGNMLFAIAYNMLCDPLDCEECKNDTYFRVWNVIPPTRPSKFSAFISAVMHSIAAKRYRDKMRQKRIPSELTVSLEELQEVLHGANSSEVECEAEELRSVISEYVRSLTERQRFIFMERFYLFKTVEQIAKEFDISRATVHREINKIKQSLKAYLERNGVYM